MVHVTYRDLASCRETPIRVYQNSNVVCCTVFLIWNSLFCFRSFLLVSNRLQPPQSHHITESFSRSTTISFRRFLHSSCPHPAPIPPPSYPPPLKEVYNIFPGVPFSMRDANDTVVLGIRAIFQYTSCSGVPFKETFYYLTGTDGVERCARHIKAPVADSAPPVAARNTTLRGGVPVVGWATTSATGGGTTTYYAEEMRGDAPASGKGVPAWYPFRIIVTDPPGGPQHGYVLDHGQHFPVAVNKWFDTTTVACPPLPPSPPPPATTGTTGPSHALKHSNPWRVLE